MGTPNKTLANSDTGARAMTAALMAVNPVAAKAWLDIMSESALFLTDRLQQDLDTQKAMLACRSPTELLQVQAKFLRSAMEQYTDYATSFNKRISTATEDTIKDVGSGHSRGYDDIPL